MNRTLYILQHIKLNPLRNHVLSSEAKKKWILNKSKQNIVRKFTSYTNRSPPPNNFWEMLVIACSVTLVQYFMRPPPGGSDGQTTNYNF